MAILEIELQPEEQARLQQEAADEGLSMQEWVQQRLKGTAPSRRPAGTPESTHEAKYDPAAKTLWEIIAELDAIKVPAEDRARVAHDGSINYKHYLYGVPKVGPPEGAE